MVIKIQQTWWHIEDQYLPSPGRKIHQVMDIFTDEEFFPLKLPRGLSFVGLHITRRDTGHEIPYIETKDGRYILSLGKLINAPEAPDEKSLEGSKSIVASELKHVKIDIEYIITQPFLKFLKYKFGYMAAERIDMPIQPEFYTTVPKGMKIGGAAWVDCFSITFKFFLRLFLIHRLVGYLLQKQWMLVNTRLKDFYKWIFEFPREGDNLGLRCCVEDKEFELQLRGPYINENNGRKRYSYSIEPELYDELKKEMIDAESISFRLWYTVFINEEILLLPIIGFVLLILSFARIYQLLFLKVEGDPIHVISYLIILISFSTFYYSLRKDNVFLPIPRLYPISIGMFVISLFGEALYMEG